MSASVITVEIPEDLSHQLMINRPTIRLSLHGRIQVPGHKSVYHRSLKVYS